VCKQRGPAKLKEENKKTAAAVIKRDFRRIQRYFFFYSIIERKSLEGKSIER